MAAEAAAPIAQVRIISQSTIRPSCRPNEESGGRVIHLTPWDLKMISVDYIQKGLLFHKYHGEDNNYISSLRTSFAATLDHFFPLAGRLAITKHDDDDSSAPRSLSVSLKCDDRGAEFIQASAPTVKVSDILDALYVPPIVLSLFPIDGLINYDGHRFPLLAVQVTELADGIFIGGSLNHVVGDGFCFWNFFNSWSEISRIGSDRGVQPPVLDRWFLDSCKPPIRLPFRSAEEIVRIRPVYTPVEECAFHFSAETVAMLKRRANAEIGGENKQITISSLQSLLARLWVSVTQARCLGPEEETTYMLLIGCRTRLTPPLPDAYLGNCGYLENVTVKTGELLQRGFSWGAWLLNQAVASYNESTVRSLQEKWAKTPYFANVNVVDKPRVLMTGSSPRFNVYGNDFGWGEPAAVRSGGGNKIDGKATIYPGPERGSMALEVCLSPSALSSLVKDEEFMELVSKN
ncbi:HXXXD-type acyl-transferase family protein [Canna indica]|uniref:HXXXD-type acyl-transferase family protein n=1 Tax=Canna indica TaxID=4628 RepID=A0AAQ3K226_9LILI|nr:HXXXD-type acyl-transferase family protein [Canna indica]